MLKHHVTVAFRNLLRNKTFSLINVAGLTVGISAALLIYLLAQYDLSFDKFEKDRGRIYRVVSDYSFDGHAYHSAGVPHGMPMAVKNEVPGLDLVAPFRVWNDGETVAIGQQVYKDQKNMAFVDENYFKLLSYQWVAGSPQTSLNQPYQIVLAESRAAQYFPGLKAADIIGRAVVFNDTVTTFVTGIVKDLTELSDFSFTTFLSRATIEIPRLKPRDGSEWGSTNRASQLFVRLTPGVTPVQAQQRINQVFFKYFKPDANARGTNTHSLEALSDLHFNADYDNFSQRQAHRPTLYGLLAIAVFLLALACINFINLTTAQASRRARETSIRKIMGGLRRQLIGQFLGETCLLTLAAALVSVALMPLLFGAFRDFLPTSLHFSRFATPGVFLFLLSLTVVVSLVSGLYPALVLSSFKPAEALKDQRHSGKILSVTVRKYLTVSQFVIAQVFIIGTILVGRQINYTLNKDLGFKKDAILYIPLFYNDEGASHRYALMQRLQHIPEIAMVSLGSAPPAYNRGGTRIVTYRDGKKEIETEVDEKFVDTNYIKLYHLTLLAGTNLPHSDTIHSLIINETYAHILGFNNPQQAIGKSLDWGDQTPVVVVGVVSDFHQWSLHDLIKPLILSSRLGDERMVHVALQPQNAEGTVWPSAIAQIRKAFKEVYPTEDLDYHFLDDQIAGYYIAEQQTARLLGWATGLAIFISCLGLLGLVIYTTDQRRKETGIRKVLGASVAQIIVLLSQDFVRLIAIAFVIAVPLAWYGIHKWLENFAYKTTVPWWVFAEGGALMFALALALLCVRTYRAATANPVDSLRAE